MSRPDITDHAKHDWFNCLDCIEDGSNMYEHPYNPSTPDAPLDAVTIADAEAARTALATADLTQVVAVKVSEHGVSLESSGQTLSDMGANADRAEIALREAGVPVKRFSVSRLYVMVDPAKRQVILDSPMPERAW